MAKKTKHQHYVSRFYLRNFSHKNVEKRDETDLIYRLDVGLKNILELSIVDAAVEKNLYTDMELSDPYQWENQFASKELQMSRSIQSIIDKSRLVFTKTGDVILSEENRLILVDGIVMQLLRTPKALNKMQQLSDEQIPYVLTYLKTMIAPYLPDAQKQYALNYKVSNSVLKSVKLQVMWDAIEKSEIKKVLLEKTWTLYRLINPSTEFNFITSDHPVVVSDVCGNNYNMFESPLISPFTMISYPLAPDILISIYGKNNRYSFGNNKILFLYLGKDQRFVDRMNQLQRRQCAKYIFKKYK